MHIERVARATNTKKTIRIPWWDPFPDNTWSDDWWWLSQFYHVSLKSKKTRARWIKRNTANRKWSDRRDSMVNWETSPRVSAQDKSRSQSIGRKSSCLRIFAPERDRWDQRERQTSRARIREWDPNGLTLSIPRALSLCLTDERSGDIERVISREKLVTRVYGRNGMFIQREREGREQPYESFSLMLLLSLLLSLLLLFFSGTFRFANSSSRQVWLKK